MVSVTGRILSIRRQGQDSWLTMSTSYTESYRHTDIHYFFVAILRPLVSGGIEVRGYTNF